MQCNKCGYESQQHFPYSPQCGDGPQPEAVSQNTAAMTVLAALKDNLFLVLCILMSTSCIFSIAADSLPLLNILTTVFLWMVYTQSRKDIVDIAQLRNVSGTIYAQYVINIVLAIIFLVAGVFCAVALSSITDSAEFLEFLRQIFEADEAILPIAESLAAVSGSILMMIFVIAAFLIGIINFFSIRYIHRFAKSVYQSVQTGVLDLKHVSATRGWLIVFAVCSGISTLSTMGSGLVYTLSGAAGCATCIIAVKLIDKYLTDK